MPTNPSSNRTLPPFMPFFSVDQQTGTFGLNSEGAVANAKLQQLLIDRERPRVKVTPEHVIQSMRQEAMDIYYEGEAKGDFIKTKTSGFELPLVSSPQRIFLGQGMVPRAEVEKQRNSQVKAFGTSFMAHYSKGIYEAIDEAMGIVDQRKSAIRSKHAESKSEKIMNSFRSKQKEKTFTENEKKYIFAPLHDAINDFNKFCVEKEKPIRIKFREIWQTEDFRTIDLFMVYPNAEWEADGPMHKWSGMQEATSMNGLMKY